MTFEQYWLVFIKQWKLIMLCFLCVGLGAFGGSRLMHPTYQSAALVQVAIQTSNSPADYSSLLASDQLVQTEALLAVSDPVLREVASHHPNLPFQLSKAVSASVKPNTQLFEIDVQDTNPERAAALANDVATTLIKQQLQQLQKDNSQSQQQLQQDLAATHKQINTVASQIADLQAQGGNQAQIAILQVELSSLQQHYNQWQSSLAQLELTQAQSGDFLLLVQPAQPPLNPVRPNVLLYTAVGFLAGLLLGLLLALILERFDTRLRTPEAISQELDMSVLATIWRTGSQEEVVNPAPRSVNSEAFRILRTNIGFAAIDKPVQTVMVTSGLPGEGKSSIAANLAIFMAKAGKKTLLIDSDLRRPSQHAIFSIPADKMGLSNAILAFSTPASAKGSANHQHPVFQSDLNSSAPDAPNFSLTPFLCPVNIPNLFVMPSGPLPPNPSELLDSKSLQRLVDEITNCGVEIVICDSPPILGMSDASILASKVDATLVVVDSTRADKRNLKQIKAMLEQSGTRVLGCVVNKQRQDRKNSAYSYYYYIPEHETGKKGGKRRSSKEKVNSTVLAPITQNDKQQIIVETQQDIFAENTRKFESVLPLQANGHTRSEISNGNKAESVHSARPQLHVRLESIDDGKGGEAENGS